MLGKNNPFLTSMSKYIFSQKESTHPDQITLLYTNLFPSFHSISLPIFSYEKMIQNINMKNPLKMR